jgi:hypothetical protein
MAQSLAASKPLHGWFATALFLAGALASSGAAAAIGEQFCTHGGQGPQKGDSVACYSDAGCRFAASLGAEPVRNFSPSSAPFALARGKITGIITSSAQASPHTVDWLAFKGFIVRWLAFKRFIAHF